MRDRGFGSTRKRPDGGWEIIYYVDGLRKTESVGKALNKPARATTDQDAIRLLAKREQERKAGTFVDPRSKTYTVNALLDDYEQCLRTDGARSLAGIHSDLKLIREAFGTKKVHHVTPPMLRAWVEEELATPRENGQPYARATIRNRLALFRAAYGRAIEEQRIQTMPYFPRRFRIHNARQGFWEREEVHRLLAVLPTHTRPFVAWAYCTGWRRGELRAFQWNWVDWTEGVIRIPKAITKNGHGRVVVFREGTKWWPHGVLLQMLWEQRTAARSIVPWVFQHRGARISRQVGWWKTACRAAGLEGKLFHDFRRTAARDLVRAGLSYKNAMDITGHLTMAVFTRYQIVDVRDQQASFAQFEAHRAHILDAAKVLPMEAAG